MMAHTPVRLALEMGEAVAGGFQIKANVMYMANSRPA